METNDQNTPASFDSDGTPLFPDGNPMLRFEVKIRKRDDGEMEKAIFIDGELLDWSVDLASLVDAARMGPKFLKEVQKDIGKHFVESVSETIGRQVNEADIKRATQTGWI